MSKSLIERAHMIQSGSKWSGLKQSFFSQGNFSRTAFAGFKGFVLFGSIGFAASLGIMSETCQVYYLKNNLIDFVPSADSEVVGKYHLNRDKAINDLNLAVPLKVTPERWVIFTDSPGVGKSWLVRECTTIWNKEKAKNGRGPVLHTDLKLAQSKEEAKEELVKTINPFFLNVPFFLTPFIHFFGFEITDDDKLRYFRVVSEGLRDEGRPVVWIFDSINCRQCLNNSNQRGNMNNMLVFLFEMTNYLIPLPVISDSTEKGLLAKVSPHIASRTYSYHPIFHETEDDFEKLLKSKILEFDLPVKVTEEQIKSAVKFIGGKLSVYDDLIIEMCSSSFAVALNRIKNKQQAIVENALNLNKNLKSQNVFEVEESLERYELLCSIANGDNVPYFSQPVLDLMSAQVDSSEPLLRRDDVNVSFVMPGTADIVRSDKVAKKMSEVYKKHQAMLKAEEIMTR